VLRVAASCELPFSVMLNILVVLSETTLVYKTMFKSFSTYYVERDEIVPIVLLRII
jgi:hypothetical protein